METTVPYIIPTRFKRKISRELSYPVGAQEISIALEEAPQLRALSLHFPGDYLQRVARGRYPVAKANYRGDRPPLYPDADGIPLFGIWEIDICAVPRTMRHSFHLYVLETALPEICRWLVERDGWTHGGRDSIEFAYDSHREEFFVEKENKIMPVRESRPKK